MSTILNGILVKSNMSKNAHGGSEMMAERLIRYINRELLEKVQIHVSRTSQNIFDEGKKQILWCHDLPSDPESKLLANGGFQKFAKLVFVSHWQRDQYISAFGMPYSHCTVIENAIELDFNYYPKDDSITRFIYHTTPHRGLELLYPIFDVLSKEFPNIHLDVYSSFGVYGWPERDRQYEPLFELLRTHPKITYHGAKSNAEVLEALSKAHLFLYPCIWPETSCIAMIEAIRSGCMVVHPTLAALNETADGATVDYDFTEDRQEHMKRAYATTRHILSLGNGLEHLNRSESRVRFKLPKNSISSFKRKWEYTLSEIVKG